jgi:YjbE family integral membrane protein
MIAVAVLGIPYIQAAGSLLLIWIAIKLLADDEGHTNVRQASSLPKAIWTIIVADFVMSLDNVLAIAAAAQNDLLIIILGIGLSMPIIIWGSTLVMKLLHKFPVFIYLGAAVLGYTAGEMFVKDTEMQRLFLGDESPLHWVIPVAATVFVVLAGLGKKMLAVRKAQ